MNQATEQSAGGDRRIGFWKCWSISVGVMIGSGVFMLPAVLAPYGSISFLGWLFTSLGAIFIALTLGRLASRTDESGGFYIYVKDAFGPLSGFLMAWSYWLSIIFAVAAIGIAFAGYAGAIIPFFSDNNIAQAALAVLLIAILTGVNLKGIAEAASLQLIMTLTKIVPLLIIIALAVFAGDIANIPPLNPQALPVPQALATTALLTMWAFLGIEAGVVPAGEVIDAKRTVPRAVITATLMVAALYIASTAAVMMLVPADTLAQSESPFSDAAAMLGPIGGPMIAIGALISTAGSMNGNILLGGQMMAAPARDGYAPKALARTNRGHAPTFALIISSGLAALLLLFNYSGGLVKTFTVLISISTLATLTPYAMSALAELRHSIANARAWALIALVAFVYVIIAIAGAEDNTLFRGAILILVGIPVFYASMVTQRKEN